MKNFDVKNNREKEKVNVIGNHGVKIFHSNTKMSGGQVCVKSNAMNASSRNFNMRTSEGKVLFVHGRRRRRRSRRKVRVKKTSLEGHLH